MRRALSTRAAAYDPRAILFSTHAGHDAAARQRLSGAAVRFDALAAVNRPGSRKRAPAPARAPGAAPRRDAAAVGARPAQRACPRDAAARAQVVALPVSIDMPEPGRHRARAVAVCYAGNPDKKGLDRSWRGMALARPRATAAGRDGDRAGARARVPARRAASASPRASNGPACSRRTTTARSSRGPRSTSPPRGSRITASPSSRRWRAARCWSRRRRAGPYEALPLARRLEPALVAAERSPQALAAALAPRSSLPEPGTRRIPRPRPRASSRPTRARSSAAAWSARCCRFYSRRSPPLHLRAKGRAGEPGPAFALVERPRLYGMKIPWTAKSVSPLVAAMPSGPPSKIRSSGELDERAMSLEAREAPQGSSVAGCCSGRRSTCRPCSRTRSGTGTGCRSRSPGPCPPPAEVALLWSVIRIVALPCSSPV